MLVDGNMSSSGWGNEDQELAHLSVLDRGDSSGSTGCLVKTGFTSVPNNTKKEPLYLLLFEKESLKVWVSVKYNVLSTDHVSVDGAEAAEHSQYLWSSTFSILRSLNLFLNQGKIYLLTQWTKKYNNFFQLYTLLFRYWVERHS